MIVNCALCGVAVKTSPSRIKPGHKKYCSRAHADSGRTRDVAERFWSWVDRSAGPNGCWPWTGATDKDGYGSFRVKRGLTVGAHRYAFVLQNGPISPGLDVMHRCDNPPCCNPADLLAGTNDDNHADKAAKGRSLAGSRNPGAKLTEGQVRLILARLSNGARRAELAGAFRVGVSTIGSRRPN